MILFAGAYLVVLVTVVHFTRATARRVMGAVAGGAAAGLWALGVIALCGDLGWWRVPMASTPIALPMFYLCLSITLMPIYPVTWRVARRFGWRGLAVFIGVVTIIGPPRDYFIAGMFPGWMVFAPGVVPILANAAAYFGMVVIGHATMRLVAGPARDDRLAGRSREMLNTSNRL